MGAAVMMMSSMAIGASAYNSGDTYSSATWTISAKYTQSTKSITKTLKAGNKVKINNGTTKNVIITSWTGKMRCSILMLRLVHQMAAIK